ncbi:fibronectin type III domain-containing protein, partial [Bathymodiolus thermophilus thioautotrophic gill symbiont]
MFNFLKYFLIVLTLVLQSCGSSGGGNSGSGLTQPTNLNAVAGDKLVNLSWNKVSGVDSYNVYHSTSNITSLSDLSKINTNTLAKTILNLTNNTKYYFVVTAVKGD